MRLEGDIYDIPFFGERIHHHHVGAIRFVHIFSTLELDEV